MRIAVINRDLCRPDRCSRECIRFCPVVKMGMPAIEFKEDIPYINEELCTGCGICPKKCPFQAISIVNLPSQLDEELVHQFGHNGFRLFRLPIPQRNMILGIVGRNGTGKSTAIKILANKIIPNLGNLDGGSPDDVLEYYRGHQLYQYFKDLYNGKLRIAFKPQEVYLLPKVIKGRVSRILKAVDERGVYDEVIDELGLREASKKTVKELSGGEMQRLAIAAAASKDADVYLFDEPSSYNDIYQRMMVAKYIRKLSELGKIVIVVDHDLAFLDYLSDYVNVVYGEPGVFGIFTRPENVRTGINIFLDGYIPSDNVRFRDKPISFPTSPVPYKAAEVPLVKYSSLVKRFHRFELTVEEGEIFYGEVVGVVGPNATGKTTFMRILVGEIKAEEGEILVQPESLAYKPQYLSSEYDGTVEEFLTDVAGDKIESSLVKDGLLKPLNLIPLMERGIKELSGGELQKVHIVATLLRDADIYFLDEPSAFIDVEDRLEVAMAINRFLKANNKPALVIDHDLLMIDAISDRIIVFKGEPGVRGYATRPLPKRDAMNIFLSDVGITLRRDKHSGRPRINKPGSRLDREQKEKGEYYYVS